MEMMEEVPRRASLVPLAFPRFLYCLIGVETEGLLDFQGLAGDHFHCTVEPSPCHIRCRVSCDTARLSQRNPPCRTLWGFWCLNMANRVRYPPLFLSVSPLESTCELEVRYPPPPTRKVSQRYLRDTYENKANGCDTPLCDTISKGYCAIWGGGISHWAATPKTSYFHNT